MRFRYSAVIEFATRPSVVSVAAAVLLFGWTIGFDALRASGHAWVTPRFDMAAMMSGYHRFLAAPWSLRPTVVTGLGPHPLSIVFTDSVPWVSLALKALGLGGLLNPLGVVLFLAYVLQPLGAISLVRACGTAERLPLLAAGLLSLLAPPWIARQFGHPALCLHALLLFGAAVAVDAALRGLRGRHIAAFGLLFAAAAGIHAYHLAPLSLMLAAALGAELIRTRGKALGRVLAGGALVSLALAAAALFLAYDVGDGAGGDESRPGFYAMNLDGPWRPAGSGLLKQTWLGGSFQGASNPTGGQGIEGYQYLGAGVLALILVALVILCANASARRRVTARAAALWPLSLAALALAVWAVGPSIYLGDRPIYDLALPDGLAKALGVFRAHGRFFWLPGYLLAAFAIAVVCKTLPRKAAAAILVAVLALQAIDSSPARAMVRGYFHTPLTPNLGVDAETAEALSGRPWVFAPRYFCVTDPQDIIAFSQTAHVALRLGGSVSSLATAHNPTKACEQPPGDLLRTAAPSDRRLTVIFNEGESRGGRLTAFANRTDCYRLRRGVLCGRGLSSLSLPPLLREDFLPEAGDLEGWIPTDASRPKPAALAEGWDQPEPRGVWSVGPRAVLRLPLAKDRPSLVTLQALAYSELPLRPQAVEVRIGAETIAKIDVAPVGFLPYAFVAPPQGTEGPVEVVLLIPGARRPPKDDRALGIGLKEIRYRPLPP